MGKVCSQCRSPLADNAVFCTFCGTAAPADMPKTKKKGTFWTILTVLLTCALVGILAFVLIFSLTGGNYVAAVNDANILFTGDRQMLETMVPQKAWDYYEDNDILYLDEIQDAVNDRYDSFIEEMEGEYGDNFVAKLVVKEAKKSSSTKTKAVTSALNEIFGIQKSSVKKVCTLDAYLSFRGDETSEKITQEDLFAVKIDNKWYLLFYNMETEAEPVFFAIWVAENICY